MVPSSYKCATGAYVDSCDCPTWCCSAVVWVAGVGGNCVWFLSWNGFLRLAVEVMDGHGNHFLLELLRFEMKVSLVGKELIDISDDDALSRLDPQKPNVLYTSHMCVSSL